MPRKKTDTRARILKTTWQLLEAGQGEGVRMSDIAKRAGITRQAVYLHFPTRVELLIATTKYIDEVKNIDTLLAPSRNAESGIDRLNAFIDAWCRYIPEIYPVAKALLDMESTDAAAAAAWKNRTQAVREGCEAAIEALHKDNVLSPAYSSKQATDILWTLLSVRNWEHLRIDSGWSQRKYAGTMKTLARRILLID